MKQVTQYGTVNLFESYYVLQLVMFYSLTATHYFFQCYRAISFRVEMLIYNSKQ